MTIINLDKNFAPFGKGIDFQQFDFPSGCEPHVKLPALQPNDWIKITCRIRSMNDLMVLILATDALRRMNSQIIEVFISYLPFARQDRVMVKGEPLSLKVITDLINAQEYDEVQLYDVHSEVSLALINHSVDITNHSFVKQVLKDKSGYFIVAPDAGAYKKIFSLCQSIGYKDEIIICNKTRNVENGQITGVTCGIKDFQGMDLYIVDDICDGGGTFVLLAKELRKRKCGKINLIVSHGIFSKGVELEGIDHIYTTNSFRDIESNENLTQIKLNHGLFS